jgi:3-oxoacyl-(acyl-carrier-protein) synthase
MHWHRVVITGLGVLAPNGSGKEPFWQACLQGRSGIRAITQFDASALSTRIAGNVPDFSPAACGLTAVEYTSLDRNTQFAIAAANMAVEDAGLGGSALGGEERERMGVYVGTAMASIEKGEQLLLRLSNNVGDDPDVLLPKDELRVVMSSNAPSAAIAAHHSLGGPSLTISTGCSSGADAIGQAFWQIQEGYADRMLAGGSDSTLVPFGFSVFSVIHALSTHNDEPERASRPYDLQRDGFVFSEGAAILLLEDRELALARGAHIYAEIRAFATNSSAYHMTAMPAHGLPLQALLRQTMAEAELDHEQLGYINSHGSSTQPNDLAETAAYKNVFGQQAYRIPISSTKSLIGHTQGAASAIETLITALALDRQILPPTINLETPDPQCDLDYIPNVPRHLHPDQPLRFALTHSSGFGGINTALVLARHESVAEEDRLASDTTSFPQYRDVPSVQITSSGRRVVITGLGAVAPNGIGKAAFWRGVRAGRLAIEPLTRSHPLERRLQFAGQVKDFRVEDYIDRKLANRTDRMTHFAFAAVQEALEDAGLNLEQEDLRRVGTVVANTLGGAEYGISQIEQFHKRGPRSVSAYTAIAWLHVANVGQLSLRHGFQGYCKTPVNNFTGGLDAFGMAYNAIRRGAADVLITGGSEAPLHPYALRVLDATFMFDSSVYRPFDQRAGGVLMAEGAGICVLEEYEHARRRGAPIYGEIVGYAQTCAPCNITTVGEPDIATYARALQLALTEARLTMEEIACVYLDGRALPAWDAAEARALRAVSGALYETLPCSVPRTQFGHSLAAAGALDTISALLALQEGILLPTLNCEEPDARFCPPGLVRKEAQEQRSYGQAALICARAFGGSHAVLAVRKI